VTEEFGEYRPVIGINVVSALFKTKVKNLKAHQFYGHELQAGPITCNQGSGSTFSLTALLQ